MFHLNLNIAPRKFKTSINLAPTVMSLTNLIRTVMRIVNRITDYVHLFILDKSTSPLLF